MKLFDEDEDASQNENISKIEINKEFARRFEHNKRREDLHRYQELKKKGQIDDSGSGSDSESESSDDEFDAYTTNLNKKQDKEFIDNLIMVKNRDPVLYQKVELFKSDDENDSDINRGEDEFNENNDKDKKRNKKKAVYLKDVVAQQLIEEGPVIEETEQVKRGERKNMTYNEEQEELRKAFLDAVSEGDGASEGDLLKVKEKGEKNEEGEDDDGSEYEKKLDEYFGREGELDEDDKFLKEFFLKRMWLDKGSQDKKIVEDDDMDALMMDEEEVDKQEEYEEKYNFRHQENAGDRVIGHSRIMEGSVRNKESARKQQRKSKEDRMKIAEMKRKEELKHLKNLKKKEMKERMKKVMEAAGINDDNDCPLDLDDLEEEFDPEEYDKMMKKAFSEKYYEAEDANPDFGSDCDEDGDFTKPDFDKEDELLGLHKGWDDVDSGDTFLAARESILKSKPENGTDNNRGEVEDVDGFEEEKEDAEEAGKRKRKRKMSLVKKVKQELLEEYYKLDYEDTIEDLKTRFKYAKVNPNRYGLKPEEILWFDDQDLNQHVSIKKLAPYREKEWKVPNSRKVPNSKNHLQKMKLKEIQRHKQNSSKNYKNRSKDKGDKSTPVPASSQEAKVELGDSKGEMGNLSRKAKRKKRSAEFKLSQRRRASYGQT